MAHHQFVGAVATQVEIDVEAHAVGADVVERRIEHAGGQGVDLDVAGAELMAVRAGERHMQGALTGQVVADRGLVSVAHRHATDPGKDAAVVDLGDAIEIDAPGREPAAVEHRQDIGVALGILGRHHGDLKRPVAASTQQSIGDPKGRQRGLEEHKPRAWRDGDLIGESRIEPSPQHLHGGGVPGAGVPGARAERLDTHQVIGEVRSLKAVAHRPILKAEMHRLDARIDENGSESELTTPLGSGNRPPVWWEIFVVEMHAELTIEGVGGIAQRLSVFGGVGVPRGGADQDPGPLHLFRLVGMQNRHLIEGSIQGPGPLTRHQGHVGVGHRGQQDGTDGHRHRTQRRDDSCGTNRLQGPAGRSLIGGNHRRVESGQGGGFGRDEMRCEEWGTGADIPDLERRSSGMRQSHRQQGEQQRWLTPRGHEGVARTSCRSKPHHDATDGLLQGGRRWTRLPPPPSAAQAADAQLLA